AKIAPRHGLKRLTAEGLTIDPVHLLQLAEIDADYGQRDQEQYDRNGAAVAHQVFAEGLVVHVHGERIGTVERPAAGHDIEDVEPLQGVDHRKRDDDDGGRGEQRQDHEDDALP